MKVIKDNRPSQRFSFPLRVTCTRCKSELEAAQTDIKEWQSDPRDPRDTGGFYVECPLCHAQNAVRPKAIASAEDYYNR